MIWDEPTAGLDPSARRFTLDLISELGKTKTVIIATHILNDIDQICDHLGIMQEGRMIYTGSMTDLKQRLGGDEFCLELAGSAEAIERVTQETMAQGLEARVQEERFLHIRLTDDQKRAVALAKVLHLIDDHDVRLEAIQSSQNTTESAYLQLLQEDEAHGFQRFNAPDSQPNNALPGDSAI